MTAVAGAMGHVAQILPLVLAWFGCYCLALELAARKQIATDWRLASAFACVGWGTILTGITEFLSLAQLLTPLMVWLAWVVVAAALLGTAVLQARQRGVFVKEELRKWWRRARSVDFSEWPWDARCYLAVTVALAAFLFAVALTFATTNWDSINYHLPRLMHWAQQESVEHFPTNNSRQIEFGPWSGFASLTVYLLWGGDRLINLVQWCAMVGSVVLVSLMVKGIAFQHDILSATQRHRITAFGCLFAATVPMGLVQCMNPQNDYTATFWLCCLVCFALALFREPGNGWYMLGAGLACGLGTLTKATVYVYAAPLVIGFGIWWLLRSMQAEAKLRLAGIFCAAFFALNAGHMKRNLAVFGSPLGSPYILTIEKNTRITASGTTANVIRNLSLYSNSGIAPLTKALNSVFARAHALTGRDYKDPEITYHNPGFFMLYNRFFVNDSYAPGPYHISLVLLAVILAALKPKQCRSALWHAGAIVASFLLFCAYLKWQHWHTRLHLAWFLLFSPVVGWILVERLPRWSIAIVAAGLVGFGGYCLIENQSRPFLTPEFATLPREKQHLAVHFNVMNEPTEKLVDTIMKSGCDNVGLKLDFDEAEYPIWVMLRNRGFKGVIQHAYVQNESRKIPARYIEPDVVIISESLGTPGPILTGRYPVSSQFGNMTLMSKAQSDEFTRR